MRCEFILMVQMLGRMARHCSEMGNFGMASFKPYQQLASKCDLLQVLDSNGDRSQVGLSLGDVAASDECFDDRAAVGTSEAHREVGCRARTVLPASDVRFVDPHAIRDLLELSVTGDLTYVCPPLRVVHNRECSCTGAIDQGVTRTQYLVALLCITI